MQSISLDRFACGRPDPQERPLDWVCDCAYEHCRQPLYFGDDCIVDEDGRAFCSELCFVRFYGGMHAAAGQQ